jgi:lipopolysaccharide transport system permease protein
MWRYRELLYFLTWRDIKVRYKQTVLGVGWSVAKPFLTVMVFSFFLGRRLAVHEGTLADYILIAFTGFLPWMFFSTSFASAAHSIVGGHELVTRVYFPRLLLPIASIGANFLDFAIGFLLLLVVMFCYGIQLGWGILLVPVIVVFLLAATLGVGTLLAALMVTYRDFGHLLQFMVQMWFFSTPSIFMEIGEDVTSAARCTYALNPVYGLIANFRQAMLGHEFYLDALAISGAVSLSLLVVGCLYFKRVERTFADLV